MLTACTKTGKNICLGMDYKKETLLLLRKEEKFLCPICGEDVTLKLGDQRIYHFAHRSHTSCRDSYEGESIYHMEGKKQLYQWLISQQISATLEYYDSVIEQRPDIMFIYRGNKYALEYQCSPLPEASFIKRTRAYLKQSYIPLWVLGHKNIKYKRGCVLSLSSFEYLFLKKANTNHYYIATYCPDEKKFHFISPILPFSIKNTITNQLQTSIHSITINDLLEPTSPKAINPRLWKREDERIKLNISLRPSPEQKRFLHEIYTQHLNLFLLPPEIGLPVRHSFLIQTPAIIWQTYVYMDVIQHFSPLDYIDLRTVERNFYQRIKKKDIILRNIRQVSDVSPYQAVIDYFQLLEKIGIVVQRGEGLFQLRRRLVIAQSNGEIEVSKKSFYQKNHHILAEI